MWQLNLLLFTQAVLGIIVWVLVHKINKMKAQMDEVTKEVKDYVSFIIEEEESKEEVPEADIYIKETIGGDEIHSSLIQAVLGEIFP